MDRRVEVIADGVVGIALALEETLRGDEGISGFISPVNYGGKTFGRRAVVVVELV